MMKKLTSILMAAVLAFALAACGQTQQTELTNSSVTDKQTDIEETPTQSASKTIEPSEVLETTSLSETDGKTLIVYFSWSTSGNTEKMAAYIQEQTGGDLLELEPLNPYPTDYEEC